MRLRVEERLRIKSCVTSKVCVMRKPDIWYRRNFFHSKCNRCLVEAIVSKKISRADYCHKIRMGTLARPGETVLRHCCTS